VSPHCTESPFLTNTPLNDLGHGYYSNPSATPVQGGLYPGGYNQRPATHNARGLLIAHDRIYPRDTDGNYAADGKIVVISIGMCNTKIEFGGTNVGAQYGFESRATNDIAKKDELVVVDCAHAGQDAAKWAGADPSEFPWTYLSHGQPIRPAKLSAIQATESKTAHAPLRMT
jgi:hypothetical protein